MSVLLKQYLGYWFYFLIFISVVGITRKRWLGTRSRVTKTTCDVLGISKRIPFSKERKKKLLLNGVTIVRGGRDGNKRCRPHDPIIEISGISPRF